MLMFFLIFFFICDDFCFAYLYFACLFFGQHYRKESFYGSFYKLYISILNTHLNKIW